VTGASSKRCQGPRAGELLAALTLDALAYKRPLRSNDETHPIPSYLPDIAASSLSPWFDDTCNAGEVLDERSAAAFNHLGASRRWESVEETYRSRSRTPPTNILHCNAGEPRRAEEDDEPEPFDLDLTLAYRFGNVK
jgi:hypothetical protein